MRGKYGRKKQRHSTLPHLHASVSTNVDREMITEPKKTKERQKEEEEPMRFVEVWKTDPKFRVEVVAVGGGLCVLVVYIFQLCAMLTSNQIIREQFRAENRPWLIFKITSEPDAQGRVAVSITNVGKTPATHVTDVDPRTRVITGDVNVKNQFWDEWGKEIIGVRKNPTDVMAPTQTNQLRTTPDETYVPGPDALVVVYGRVDYAGAYAEDEHYWTEFCFAYTPPPKTPPSIPWSTCIAHNVMK